MRSIIATLAMIELKQFVGKEIQVLIPAINDSAFRPVMLHGVESGGIWISGDEINEMVHRVLKTKMLARTPVLFFPYAQIGAILQSIEGTQILDSVLSE
jgi:hypothetical protein